MAERENGRLAVQERYQELLGDLGQALANVALELCVGVGDQSSNVWYCTLVNDGLGELFGVLCDFRESSGSDSL